MSGRAVLTRRLAQFVARAALTVIAAATLLGGAGLEPASAQQAYPQEINIVGSERGAVRRVTLGLNKSVIVQLPRPTRDVLVSNPNIVDAVVRGLRKKCGDAAGMFETVRGVGYRLRA